MYKHFARAFSERGIEFYAVEGMGSGTLREFTDRALQFNPRARVLGAVAQPFTWWATRLADWSRVSAWRS